MNDGLQHPPVKQQVVPVRVFCTKEKKREKEERKKRDVRYFDV